MRLKVAAAVLVSGLFLSAQGWAQSATTGSIAGNVKDATGAVLPGVTVEASSPSLIEKTRAVITDSQGNYKIVDLRPGVYTVTFTLPGFSTVKREGLELTTGFTANVNADMPVGSVEETVTVTGASPVVDVQNVRQQLVLTRDIWEALPTSKTLQSYVSLTLGAQYGGAAGATSQDVGGTKGEAGGRGTFTIHGARTGDSQIFIDGLNIQHGTDPSIRLQHPNQLAFEETTIGGGISAELEQAGIVINMVPKEGGNRFTGLFAANGTNGRLQSSNLTPELIARGIGQPQELVKLYDVGFGIGGRIIKDRLWFYEASRWWTSENTIPGSYHNATPEPRYGIIPIYTPDFSRPALARAPHHNDNLRLTWQPAAKHKISAFLELYDSCTCGQNNITAPYAPEAGIDLKTPYGTKDVIQVAWNYPATNRLLFEARTGLALYLSSAKGGTARPEGVSMTAVPMRDINTGFSWNALGDERSSLAQCCPYSSPDVRGWRWHNDQQASMTFVTGSHTFKAGTRVLVTSQTSGQNLFNTTPYGAIRIDVRGGTNGVPPVPAGIYQLLNPFGPIDTSPERNGHTRILTSAFYAQDQWAVRHLTMSLGLRYDATNARIGPQVTVPNDFVGSQTFEAVTDSPSWKDLSPRLGASYDLFGTGRTAVKASIGRYVSGGGRGALNSPAGRIGLDGASGARTWNDANGDFVPNCDLKNPQANGECGRLANLNRGLAAAPSTFFDPDYLVGFGVRQFVWQTTAGVQHELRGGVGLNVTYFRTSYGNFTPNDNRAVSPADYNEFCVDAPTDPLLGSVSGQRLCGLYDLSPAKFGQVNNFVTSQKLSSFDKTSEVFNGVDVSVNARFGTGGVVQGGVSTGQTVVNSCVVIDSPQAARPGFCRTTNPWKAQTQIKMFGSYPLPWWGLQVSGTFQNLPGPTYNANRVYRSAEIAPSLGRPLASGPNGFVSVPLVPPFTLFEERFTQVDLRVTKVITTGRIRTQLQADAYNVFNASSVLGSNSTYGATWQRPIAILDARLVKFGVQVDWR